MTTTEGLAATTVDPRVSTIYSLRFVRPAPLPLYVIVSAMQCLPNADFDAWHRRRPLAVVARASSHDAKYSQSVAAGAARSPAVRVNGPGSTYLSAPVPLSIAEPKFEWSRKWVAR